MRTNKDLEQYRLAVQDAVAHIGRDDIGVGAVEEAPDGMLAVTFQRGAHTDTREIPADALRERTSAHQAVMAAIRQLSKTVEQETMKQAGAAPRPV